MTSITSLSGFKDSKPHYMILDGLRGVAALMVIFNHVFEGFSFAQGGTPILWFNHGYLAVDFFFILSGFVVGYAYNDRIGKSLSTGEFFLRRLIRLHPMVVLGAVWGLVTFCIQGCVSWGGERAGIPAMLVALVCACFFIPALPDMAREVRGNGEMFPLNGPSWSLFFEYIGNIFYALFIRRLNNKALTLWVVILAAGVALFALGDPSGYGCIGVGWTLDSINFQGGMLRMLFPFSLGVLLSRKFNGIEKGLPFWLSSVILIVLVCVPQISGSKPICMNGLFELCCVFAIFPLMVWWSAGHQKMGTLQTKVCRFLGDISFPLYAIHYPVMYLFYAWLIKNELYTINETWPVAICVCLVNILLAWGALRLYDIPVRRFLAKKLLHKA